MKKSLVYHWCAQFCFTDCPAGLVCWGPSPCSPGVGWAPGEPGPGHHPHGVTASPSRRAEQHPLCVWLREALGRAHHSGGRLGRVAFIPSYQHTRGYSWSPAGDLAAQQPQAWLVGAGGISIQNLYWEDVPWNWKHVIMSPTAPGCCSLITFLLLEHSPFGGLGGSHIPSSATGHPGQS